MVVLSVGLTPPKEAPQLAGEAGHRPRRRRVLQDRRVCTRSRPRGKGCSSAALSRTQGHPRDGHAGERRRGSGSGFLRGGARDAGHGEGAPAGERRDGEAPRIGVFVCHCGINIGGVVDVPGVVEYAATLPDVVYADENLLHLLAGYAGEDEGGDRGAGAQPGRGRLLLAPDPRAALPGDDPRRRVSTATSSRWPTSATSAPGCT